LKPYEESPIKEDNVFDESGAIPGSVGAAPSTEQKVVSAKPNESSGKPIEEIEMVTEGSLAKTMNSNKPKPP
jgi:hypothetical protein